MKLLLLVLVLLLSPLSVAASPLAAAERAMQAGQSQDAVDLVARYRPATHGETIRRLWILGVANNRLNRPRAAIEPLDKLVAMVPGHLEFRLELALALLRAGQTERARYHFAQAKAATAQPAIQARVQVEIDKIDSSKNWQGYFRFAIVPESNAVRRTAAETVSLGGLIFNLQPGAQAQPALGVELGFGLAALPRLSDDLRGRFAFDVLTRAFDGRAPDDTILRVSAGVLHFGDNGKQGAFEVFATQRWLDQAAYSRSLGITLRHARLIGAQTNLAASITHERLNYLHPAYRVDKSSIEAKLIHNATPQLQLSAGVHAEHRLSANTSASGRAYGFSLGGQYSFAGGLRAGLVASFDHNKYDGIHALFGVRRVDRKSALMVQINNQNWSHKGFSPVLRLGFERQRSSIVVNSYQNLTASIGLTRSF